MPPLVDYFIPCYQRPEYTSACVDSLLTNTLYPAVTFHFVDDGSNDRTSRIMLKAAREDHRVRCYIHTENCGLHARIQEFWLSAVADFIGKLDNDCRVSRGWLTRLMEIFAENPELELLSPTTDTGHEAHHFGQCLDKSYLKATDMGGLWLMKKASVLSRLSLDQPRAHPQGGIAGAWETMAHLRRNGVVMGWAPDVVVEHVGHHGGQHPDHIKSEAHAAYSQQVGRPIWWRPQ